MKICLLGDGAVGKTAIREVYLGGVGSFRANYLQTIGADFALKTLETDGTSFRLQIWDLAGQVHFSAIRSLYYKGSNGLLLVFDVTREDSLENLGNWISEVSKILDNLKDLPLIVAGNKIDLRDAVDTSVSKEDAVKYIKEITSSVDLDFVSYVETSAKTGENIDEIFSKLVNSILNKNK